MCAINVSYKRKLHMLFLTSFSRTSVLCLYVFFLSICRAYLYELPHPNQHTHKQTHKYTQKLKSAINWRESLSLGLKRNKAKSIRAGLMTIYCSHLQLMMVLRGIYKKYKKNTRTRTLVQKCDTCVGTCVCQRIFHCLAVSKSRLYKLPAIILSQCRYLHSSLPI